MRIRSKTSDSPSPLKTATSSSPFKPAIKTVLLVLTACAGAFVFTISYLTPVKLINDLGDWGTSHGHRMLHEGDSVGEAYLKRWAVDRGYGALRQDVSLHQAFLKLPVRFARSLLGQGSDIPRLHIDINFKNMQKIHKKRADALAKGILVQGPDDFIPASIRYGDRTIKVKLRLKGDWTEHLEGEKWSFRIHVKRNDQIFGMRRFSIQHPKVRGYQGEALFFETLRYLDVLAPRYFFVLIAINGDNKGVMALEEHFSKELLESNGKREGVIIRFDESLVWVAADGVSRGFDGVFDDYRNAPLDAFRSSRIAKSPRLTKEYKTASGLLRGFVNGYLRASEIFDAKLMGRFLAAAELWGSLHSIRWHNQRFYFNPITAKLEPIGFDADIQHRSHRAIVSNQEPIVSSMLEDPEIFRVYEQTLQQLARNIADGNLQDRLRKAEKRHLASLQKEFYLLEGFPYNQLKTRAEQLVALPVEDLKTRVIPAKWYPLLFHAHVLNGARGPYLELTNAVPHDLDVRSITWVAKSGSHNLPFNASPAISLPLHLAVTQKRSLPSTKRIYFQPPRDAESYVLQVTGNIRGQKWQYVAKATNYPVPIRRHPIPVATAEEQLALHPFLTLDRASNTFNVKPGRWRLRGSLIVSEGYSLKITAGTTLEFPAKEGLFAHGPVHLQGSGEAPILLEGVSSEVGRSTWQGIAILSAGAPSKWSDVTIRNTTGIDRGGWRLTGGVTFYQSDIRMERCRFEGNRAEDALNLVHSQFTLTDVRISDTLSDAIDVDFADGMIKHGLFRNIGVAGGGDGLDTSGSVVQVSQSHFVNITDKALSVGEASQMTARRIVIEQAGTAAASKDGSYLDLADSTIRQARYAGLMAYIKKPEFGPARLEARNVQFIGDFTHARVQNGSSITIDGRSVDTENVDVAELYETVMKRGLR